MIPPRYSQSLLGRFERCPKSAELQVKHRDLTGHPQLRGIAFHEVAERMAREALEADETRFPADMAKPLLVEVLDAHPEWVIPTAEVDALRAMVWNYAEHSDFSDVVQVEWPVHHTTADGHTVSGRIDLVRRVGSVLEIEDLKTSLAIRPQEEVEQGFQGITYAVLAMHGVHKDTGEPLDLSGVEAVAFRETYPRYVGDEGLVSRRAVFSADRILDHDRQLERLAAHAYRAFHSQEFVAVPGSHCATCPAPAECPIPVALRGWQGATREIEDLAALWLLRDQETKALWKELRAHASEYGEIPLGTDLALSFSQVTRREVDRDGLLHAARAAAAYGEEFDPDEFVRVSHSTQFRKVKR